MSGALLQHPRFDFAVVFYSCGGCGRVQQYDGNGLILNVGFDNHRPTCFAYVAGFLQFDVLHAFSDQGIGVFVVLLPVFGLYRVVVGCRVGADLRILGGGVDIRLRSLAVETFWKLGPVGS